MHELCLLALRQFVLGAVWGGGGGICHLVSDQ